MATANITLRDGWTHLELLEALAEADFPKQIVLSRYDWLRLTSVVENARIDCGVIEIYGHTFYCERERDTRRGW